ncbi:MAG: hypothetical protein HQ534_08885 [Armatimonadetes bacterium]|nr:hypothetical protein [Armatimonadota bacterium]
MKDIFLKYLIEPIIKLFSVNKRNIVGFWIIIGVEFSLILLLPLNKFSGLKNIPESLNFLQKPITFIFSYPAYCKILFFIFIFILTYLIWLFRSGRLIIPSKKLKVAVALSPDNIASDSILTKTLLMTNSKLKSLNLLDNIHIFKIGTDLFNTNKDAEKYLKRKKINLVIHGNIHYGKKENKVIFNLKDFSFSYYIPQVPRNPGSMNMIKKDINLMLTHRNWIVEESNSLSGSEAIATNFVEILLSIIGIASSFSKDYINTSVLLIEKLLPFLEKQIEPYKRKIEINRNKKNITMPISLLRSGRLRSILINCYLNISDLFFEDKEYNKIIEFINKALKAGANKSYCYPSVPR